MIPLCKPHLGKEELKAVEQVLDSGILTGGEKVKQFEEEFAKYIGTDYAVSLNSCTSALELSVKLLGLKRVICPSFTFVATANAIINAGATPVFCDIDINTYNIAPFCIKKLLENDSKIDGIMPVHYSGQPCEMDKIMELANKYNLKVIEDSAECIGGTFDGKKTGGFGDVGCFSFHPVKNMTCGEGGMVTTNDKKLADKIRLLSAHGVKKTNWHRNAIEAGYNYRMTTIQAAIGLIQLKKLNNMNEKRIALANYYDKKLKIIYSKPPFVHEKCKHVYQMYVICVTDRDGKLRALNKNGIESSAHFSPPVHQQTYYVGRYGKQVIANTDWIHKSLITLPMYPDLKKEEIDEVVKCLKDVNVVRRA